MLQHQLLLLLLKRVLLVVVARLVQRCSTAANQQRCRAPMNTPRAEYGPRRARRTTSKTRPLKLKLSVMIGPPQLLECAVQNHSQLLLLMSLIPPTERERAARPC